MSGELFEAIQKRLVFDYGADNGAKDQARTLRLPGTWNLKPGRAPHLVTVIDESGYRYTADELSAAFPPVPKEKPLPRPSFDRYSNRGDLGRFVEWLACVSPDDYQTWLEIGMALHNESGGKSDGLAMWDAWSATSAKWSDGECSYRWQTFRAGRGVTGGTVFQHATDAGYKKPEKKQRTQAKARTEETVYSAPVDEPKKWRADLILSESGNPKPILANAIVMLRSDPEWLGVLAFDEFACRTVIRKKTPWCKTDPKDRPWTDRDDLLATDWLQHRGVCVPKQIAGQAVEAVAGDNSFHPVRQYLGGLRWDGVKRVETLASAYFGGLKSEANRLFSERFMIAAVARIFDPGCKADNVLIIEGNQGDKKSSGFKALAGPAWFTDELADLGSKDAGVQMQGVWLIEMAELDTLSRSEVGRAKAFFSRTNDRFRPPYGTRAQDFPRQCIFVGTTNKDDYLKDETGERRFWPVRGSKVDVAGITRDRDQLWAEAVALYRNGNRWWLEGDEIGAARAEQEARQFDDLWEDRIAEYTDGKTEVTIADILQHGLMIVDSSKMDQAAQNRVARVLKKEKTDSGEHVWERKQKRFAGMKPKWVYRRAQIQDA